MCRRIFAICCSTTFFLVFATRPASAELPEELNPFVWVNTQTGPQEWLTGTNWDVGTAPNGSLDGADLSVALGSDLTLNFAAPVTMGGILMGGTSVGVSTTIAGPGLLTFHNEFDPPAEVGNADFNGDSVVNGRDYLIWARNFGATGQLGTNELGNADNDDEVDGDDLPIWEAQFGNGLARFRRGAAFISTDGVAGSVNVISAPIHLNNEVLEIAGPTDLLLSNNFSFNAPADASSSAALRVKTVGTAVTINGDIAVNATFDDGARGPDLSLMNTSDSSGTLILNGVISGSGRLHIGNGSGATIELNGNNTFRGGFRAGQGNFILATDNAIGFDPAANEGAGQFANYRTNGAVANFNLNFISTDDSRNLGNDIVLAGWQTVRGEHSLTLSGNIEMTNNRGFMNLLPEGKSLTLAGNTYIWESGEQGVIRRFTFDGNGETRITGTIINDVPIDPEDEEPILTDGLPAERRIVKTGTGTLLIDTAGTNTHDGFVDVNVGYLRFTSPSAFNTATDAQGGTQFLRSTGGAIGVDTGIANLADAPFDPVATFNTGGLMLTASDAAAPVDFTTTFAMVSQMSVAAPKEGLVYTGTITPANSTYRLGGGSGTLTLPNAQLVGSNSLEVKNESAVELLGDNTFTGSTTVIAQYHNSFQNQAIGDTAAGNGSRFYEELAPVLVVDKLADGGNASSIGAASNDAANLVIQGSTLKYVGEGDATDRLFTVGTGGATIDASGSGAVSFTNAGEVNMKDPGTLIGDLNLFDSVPRDTVLNIDPNSGDFRDVIVGMQISNSGGAPYLGFAPANIPMDADPEEEGIQPVVVTGVSQDGKEITYNAQNVGPNPGFGETIGATIHFLPVERTLTLTGSNEDANTIASVIGDSAAGGVVSISKEGAGTWVLTGANTYSGDTSVVDGTLSITNAFLHDDSEVRLFTEDNDENSTSPELNLDFVGTDTVAGLFFDGSAQDEGLWGAVGNGAAQFTSSLITGSGLLNVVAPMGGELLASTVPEPTAAMLMMLAVGMGSLARKRR